MSTTVKNGQKKKIPHRQVRCVAAHTLLGAFDLARVEPN